MTKYYNPTTGYSYSYDEVLIEAQENNLSFEDFVKEYNLETKEEKEADPLTQSIDANQQDQQNFQLDPQEGALQGPVQKENAPVSMDSSGNILQSGLQDTNAPVEDWLEETESGIANNPQWNTSDILKWESRPGGPSQVEIEFYKEAQKRDIPDGPTPYVLNLYNSVNDDFSNYSKFDLDFEKDEDGVAVNPSSFESSANNQINFLRAKLRNISLDNSPYSGDKEEEIQGEIKRLIKERDTNEKEKLTTEDKIFQAIELSRQEENNIPLIDAYIPGISQAEIQNQAKLLETATTAYRGDVSAMTLTNVGDGSDREDILGADWVERNLYSGEKAKGLTPAIEQNILKLLNDGDHDEIKSKLKSGVVTLDEKEALIAEARGLTLDNTYDELNKDVAKAEDALYEYGELKEVPQEEFDKLKLVADDYNKKRDQAFIEIGFNTVDQTFNDSFKLTENVKKWNDMNYDTEGLVKEGFIGGALDFGLTLGQGIGQIAAEVFIGWPVFLATTGFNIAEGITGMELGNQELVNDLLDKHLFDKNFVPTTSEGAEKTLKGRSFMKESTLGGLIPKGEGTNEEGFGNDLRFGTKTIAELLPFTLGVIRAAKKGNVKEAGTQLGLIKPIAKRTGIKAKKLQQNYVMGKFAFEATARQNYMEGTEMGLSNLQASAYASSVSLGTAVTQSIMPDVNFFKGITGAALKKGLVTNLEKAATKKATQQVIKTFGLNLMREIGEEEADLLWGKATKIAMGLSDSSEIWDAEEQFQTVMGTILLSGSMGATAAPSQYKGAKKFIYNQYRVQGSAIIGNLSELRKMALKKANRKNSSPKSKADAAVELKQINDSLLYAQDIMKAINVSADLMSDSQLDLLVKKEQLIRSKKGMDKSAAAGIDEQIKEIDVQISNSAISKNIDSIYEKQAKNVGKLADQLEMGFTEGNTATVVEEINKQNEAIKQRNKGKSKKDQESLIDLKEAKENGVIIINPDGTRSILVNRDVAKTKRAVTTAQHELLHGVLLQTIKNNPGGIQAMSLALKSEIDNMIETVPGSADIYLGSRLEAYKKDPSSIKAEEMLTIFSEGITQGFIKYEEGAFVKIGDKIRQFFQDKGKMDIEFNTGRDVYNFIKDFNKSVEKGVAGKALVKATKEGAKVGLSVNPFKDNEAFSNEISQVYNSGTIRNGREDNSAGAKALKIAMLYRNKVAALIASSKEKGMGSSSNARVLLNELLLGENANSVKNIVQNYDASLGKSLTDTIGEAIGARIGLGSTQGVKRSKTDLFSRVKNVYGSLDTFANKTEKQKSDAASLIGYEYTDVVKKKLKKYNTLEGFNAVEDNLIADATYTPGKGGVYDLVRTFNKDGKQIINQEINAYIQGLLDNRILGVVQSYKLGKAFSAGQASDQKNLADKTDNVQPDAPKFASITESNTFSPLVYDEVKSKVLQTVRVLKSKINSSKSINKRSTELISEIKQSISISADAIIKNAMGGKPSNKLKNFLLKTKKQSLENFTTTWMMGQDVGDKVNGGIPQAIQKSIDGKYKINSDGKRVKNDYGDFIFEPNFVSYPAWVGLEPDRVKTSTDAAGQTSGNQLVRRIPNVNEKISNEVYLSNILKEDGTPIRGRKEAYAKEMAGELGLEIFFDQANVDSDISRAFEKRQEMLGEMIGDNLISTLETQIERGNIKRSASSTVEMQAQLTELMSNAIKNGTDSATFENIIMETDPKVVEAAEELGILSLFDSGKTGFKAPLVEWNNFPIIFEEQLGLYKSTITSKTSKESMEQLASFSDKLIDILPPEVLAAIPDDMLGIQYGYLDGAKSKKDGKPGPYYYLVEKKRKKQKELSSNLKLTFEPKDIRIFNAGSGIMGQIGTILDKDISKDQKLKQINKKFGEVIEKANVANIAALEYLMDSATEAITNNPDLTTGFMRWMESSTSNAKGQRGLTTFDMLDVRDGSQKASEIHPDYADALVFATEAAEKAWSNLSKPKKALTTKEQFIKSRLENPKTGALKHLRYKGEHVNPAANVMLDLAKVSLLTASKIIRTPTLTGTGHDVFRLEAGLKYKQILANYSQTLGVELYSAIQDKKLGTTSALQDFRGLALEQDQLGNFITLEGVQAINYIQRKLLSLESIDKIISDVDFNALAVIESAESNAIKEIKSENVKRSKEISNEFNNIIEQNKNIGAEKIYSDVVAKSRGRNKGWWKLFLPPSAEDFRGLLNVFVGKGENGNKQQQFFVDNLISPYTKGISKIESYRQALKNDYSKLLKTFPQVKKQLGKTIPDEDFTFDQAIRVYLYTKSGFDIPGISKRDAEKLNRLVNSDESLSAFADSAILISKKNKWAEPSDYWDSGSILSDLSNITERIGRKEFLEEFITNSKSIFSKDNLNKIQAVYGTSVREALEDSLYRMVNGTNRPSGQNALTNRFNNWINNSVGAIMFFNRKSALLQTLSTVNFMNWSDNNPIKAAIAFGNQPQYWSDFVKLFNSDKLKQRRSGLRSDINEAEIANAAKTSANKAQAAISYLLKIGFTPTQLADSFAIAAGGATMYRNRINTYLKNGLSKTEAETKAFEDFSLISDETQQSADPMLISQQQASMLGRFILSFQNTPMQMTRLMKKAGQMLINRRKYPNQNQFQSDTTNISKIVYYGGVQNFIFSALQNALFALLPGFMDDEEDDEAEEKKQKLINTKTERIVNSMADTLLRGSGVYGAIISTIKNVVNEYYKQEEKGFTADHTYTILQATNLSPAVGSKLRKIYSGIQTNRFEKDPIAERGWDATIDGRLNLSPKYSVLGSVTEALTNIPLERAVIEITSIVEALDARNTLMQRIAMALGFRSWGVGAKNEEHDIIKTLAKIKRKEEGKIKAKETRRLNKIKKQEEFENMSMEEQDSVLQKRIQSRINSRMKQFQ